MLLIAGGSDDPHLERIARVARARAQPLRMLRVGPDSHPRLHLDLTSRTLRIDGEGLQPTALFLRHDIYAWLADRRGPVERRAATWYDAVLSWAWADPALRMFNRRASLRRTSKVLGLIEARHAGLRIPDTLLSNDAAALGALGAAAVAKPLLGGAYTLALEAALDEADREGDALLAPALVQPRLDYPELRLQLIGRQAFAFEIHSTELDHRLQPEAIASEVRVPTELLGPLRRVADRLGLDLCAADFKTCPRTGQWVFLEINSQPMWTAFDDVVHGRLAEAIVEELLAGQGESAG